MKLKEAEAVGRTNALGLGLDEAERREKATAATLSSVQAELASARAELFSLQQQFAGAESSVQRGSVTPRM